MVETTFQLEPVKECLLYKVIQFKKKTLHKCYLSIWSQNFGGCSEMAVLEASYKTCYLLLCVLLTQISQTYELNYHTHVPSIFVGVICLTHSCLVLRFIQKPLICFLFSTGKQMTGFYMKYNTRLTWVESCIQPFKTLLSNRCVDYCC